MSDSDLLAEVAKALEGTGCEAVELGPHSVAVMGDARFYGPSVIVKFPPGLPSETWAAISTKITNEVKGISRVLMDVTPASP